MGKRKYKRRSKSISKRRKTYNKGKKRRKNNGRKIVRRKRFGMFMQR